MSGEHEQHRDDVHAGQAFLEAETVLARAARNVAAESNRRALRDLADECRAQRERLMARWD